MTLIKIRNRKVANIALLVRLVLKNIYEPQNMSLEEEEFMQRSFIGWAKNEFKSSDQTDRLQRLAKLMKDNQDGKLEKRKALFKEHGIDYRKYHRLPEAYDYSKDNLVRIAKIAEMERANHAWRN